MAGEDGKKKMKILCLHGFRTSGDYLKMKLNNWDPSILQHFDMDFLDGSYPASGETAIEGIFPPPYFEWYQFNKELTEFTNLDKCLDHLCGYIESNGPFDGLLGFSQGAALSGLVLGCQAQGKILQNHPPMKIFVSMSGSKIKDQNLHEVAYKDVIKVKSVHIIGDEDWLKLANEEFVTAFEDPLIIRHPGEHVIPMLDEDAARKLRNWCNQILL